MGRDTLQTWNNKFRDKGTSQNANMQMWVRVYSKNPWSRSNINMISTKNRLKHNRAFRCCSTERERFTQFGNSSNLLILFKNVAWRAQQKLWKKTTRIFQVKIILWKIKWNILMIIQVFCVRWDIIMDWILYYFYLNWVVFLKLKRLVGANRPTRF